MREPHQHPGESGSISTQLGLGTEGDAKRTLINNNSIGEAVACPLRLHNIAPLEEIQRVRVRVRVGITDDVNVGVCTN